MKISFNRVFLIPLKPSSNYISLLKIIKIVLVCIDYNDPQTSWTKAKEAIIKNNNALQC